MNGWSNKMTVDAKLFEQFFSASCLQILQILCFPMFHEFLFRFAWFTVKLCNGRSFQGVSWRKMASSSTRLKIYFLVFLKRAFISRANIGSRGGLFLQKRLQHHFRRHALHEDTLHERRQNILLLLRSFSSVTLLASTTCSGCSRLFML